MPTGEDADGEVLYLPELFIDSPLINSYPHPKWINLPVSDAKEQTDGDDVKTKDTLGKEIISKLKLMDVSERTIQTAKKELGITSYRKNSAWYWHLPDGTEELRRRQLNGY